MTVRETDEQRAWQMTERRTSRGTDELMIETDGERNVQRDEWTDRWTNRQREERKSKQMDNLNNNDQLFIDDQQTIYNCQHHRQ